MGKRARVFCSDIPGERYSFLWKGIEAAEASDALCICLGELTDNARPFAAEHRIAIWQSAELAQALQDRKPVKP